MIKRGIYMNKIKDPLQNIKIPSKTYLYAYGEKIHSYALQSKILHSSSKITEWVNKLGDEYFDIEDPKKINGRPRIYFQSKSQPLINRLPFIASKDDKDKIKTFLDSNFFRNYIKEITNNLDFHKNYNAIESIFGTLAIITIFTDKISRYAGPKFLRALKTLSQTKLKDSAKKEIKEIKKKDYLMKYIPSDKFLEKDFVSSSLIICNTFPGLLSKILSDKNPEPVSPFFQFYQA